MIKLENVVKSYPVAGEDLIVLKDINLTIEKGNSSQSWAHRDQENRH